MLQVDNLTTATAQIIREDNLTTNSFNVVAALSSGNYRFWVRAINATNNAPGPWSIPIDFTVTEVKSEESDVDVLLTSFTLPIEQPGRPSRANTDDAGSAETRGPSTRHVNVPVTERREESLAQPVAPGNNNPDKDSIIKAADQQISRMVESGLWIDER